MNKRKATYVLGIMSIYAALFSPVCGLARADDMDNVMRIVHTPEELERFYAKDFASAFRIPAAALTHDEFLRTKSGNCQDFANLSQDVLGRLGIKSEVVYMKFHGLKIGHAVCMWKEGNYYSFFDNRKLIRTNETSIEGVLRTYYPDLECCTGCERGFDVDDNTCM